MLTYDTHFFVPSNHTTSVAGLLAEPVWLGDQTSCQFLPYGLQALGMVST